MKTEHHVVAGAESFESSTLAISAGMQAIETSLSSSSRRMIRTPCVLRPMTQIGRAHV